MSQTHKIYKRKITIIIILSILFFGLSLIMITVFILNNFLLGKWGGISELRKWPKLINNIYMRGDDIAEGNLYNNTIIFIFSSTHHCCKRFFLTLDNIDVILLGVDDIGLRSPQNMYLNNTQSLIIKWTIVHHLSR